MGTAAKTHGVRYHWSEKGTVSIQWGRPGSLTSGNILEGEIHWDKVRYAVKEQR